MLADAQGWDEVERALQLMLCFCDEAVEVLGCLTPTQRISYSSVMKALQRKFGRQHQAEVHCAWLKNMVRGRDEQLPQFAQVRWAYPVASEEMVVVLARDHFMDALQDLGL